MHFEATVIKYRKSSKSLIRLNMSILETNYAEMKYIFRICLCALESDTSKFPVKT